MTTMNNEDPADPSVHEPRISDVELPEPVMHRVRGFIRSVPQPWRPYGPICPSRYLAEGADVEAQALYTADQMREAIAAERAENERLRELADSEGSRAVEYLRRARKAEAALSAQPAPVAEDALPEPHRLDSWSTEPSEPATNEDHLPAIELPEPASLLGMFNDGVYRLYTADQMREAIAAEHERSHELLQAADHIRAGLEAKLAALSAALAAKLD